MTLRSKISKSSCLRNDCTAQTCNKRICGKPPRLRRNIAALGLVQIANYIVPIVTIPYLTRVLGPIAYGKVLYAQVLIAYFVMFVDFGFSWSATRKIAAHRDSHEYVSKFFVNTWIAQWLLLVVSAAVAAPMILLTPKLRPDAMLYITTYASVVGTVLFPIWFFQGLERLQVVAAIQATTRISALPLIFTLVTHPDNLLRVPVIIGVTTILGGILALIWIFHKRLIDWQQPTWSCIWTEFREALPLFGSRLSISFYTTFVPLVLGWVAGPTAIANFTIADKIRIAVQSIINPISQALYPRMSHLFATADPNALHLIRLSGLAVTFLAGAGGLFVFLGADSIILVIAGSQYVPAISVLRWLAFLPLIIGLSNLFGVQIMLANKMHRAFNLIIITASFFGVLLIRPAIILGGANGAAVTMLIVESFVTATMAIYLWRSGIVINLEPDPTPHGRQL